MPDNASIGVDPWCVSVEMAQKWENAFSRKQQKLIQLSTNLVDEVWKDRPLPEIQPVHIQPLAFAGRSVSEKLKELREKLSNGKASGIILTTLDEVIYHLLIVLLLGCTGWELYIIYLCLSLM